MHCVLILKELTQNHGQINFTSLQSIFRGCKFITSVCESTSGIRHGRGLGTNYINVSHESKIERSSEAAIWQWMCLIR